MSSETKSAPVIIEQPKESTRLEIQEELGTEFKGESTGIYEFVPTEETFPLYNSHERKELLMKWGMDTQLVFKKFRFNERFNEDNINTFLVDFFNSPVVQSEIQITIGRELGPISGRVSEVEGESLKTSQLSMSFFDRLFEGDECIVSQTGYIKKCMDDVFNGASCNDLLREMFLNEESENFFLFDDEDEQKEFLFHCLKRVVIGGACCQNEDYFAPYSDAAKDLYKGLLRVTRNSTTKAISVASKVWQIHSVSGDWDLFPNDKPYNYCYVIVDPWKKTVTYWSAAFTSFW